MAREALADGLDPVEVRKAKVREAKARSEETFGAIGDEWFDRLKLQRRAPNPDLPVRFEQGAELNTPDKGTFYSEGAKGCIDYAALDSAGGAQ